MGAGEKSPALLCKGVAAHFAPPFAHKKRAEKILRPLLVLLPLNAYKKVHKNLRAVARPQIFRDF